MALIDAEDILSGSEQWVQLDQKWGTPVDLDTEEYVQPNLKTAFSTLDLMKSTFDSSFVFKRQKVARNISKKSMDYRDFLQDLDDAPRNTPDKQFYFINGQIISAISVDEICEDIDDIFKSMDKLCSATSTVRINKKLKPNIPDVVQCSISTGDLSFDDTVVNASGKEKCDSDDLEGYIDEVFGHLDSTLSRENLEYPEGSSKESVTTLVRKFTSMLKRPGLKCTPRKRRQCCDRFKDLTEFWQSQSVNKTCVLKGTFLIQAAGTGGKRVSYLFLNNIAMLVLAERKLLVPAHLNFGKYVLDRLRKAEPERTCWHNCTTGEKLSYSEFTQHAVRLAAALAQHGVGRGDTVLVGGDCRVAELPTRLAVILTGATCTTVELQCGRAVLAHKLNLTKPKYFICTRLFWEAYSDLLKSLDFVDTFISFEAIEDMELNVEAMVSSSRPVDVATFEPAAVSGACDVAVVAYSSGTTGMSKGVLLTHLNCIVECNMQIQWYNDFDSYQTAGQTLQTTFIASAQTTTYDFFMICASICAGKTVIYSENEVDNWKMIQDLQVDTMPTVPAVVDMMLNIDKDMYDLSSLRLVYSAGSTLQPRTKKAFKERYPDVLLINLYGASEVGYIATTTNAIAITDAADEAQNGETLSVGHAAPDVTIKVVDLKTRAALGPNERGEVCVRCPRLMKGYLGATAPYLDEQGFYLTGDLGYYDDQKRFYLVDRLNDIISHFGYNVSPRDVEAVLLQHSAVSAAAVAGAPAGAAGEHAAAFVVLRPGATATAAELQDYVAQEVTWYMRLAGGVRFLPELPRNLNGKVLRRRLREMLEQE